MIRHIFLVLFCSIIYVKTFSQENAVYTINSYYYYYHHQVDGNTTTVTSSAYVALDNGQGNYIGEIYLTNEENLDLTYYRTLSYSFNNMSNCIQFGPQLVDEFTQQWVNYCSARTNLQNRSISLGATVDYGNKNNAQLLGTYQALNCYAKSWLLPYVSNQDIISIGYCNNIFERDGFHVTDGQWEYLEQGNNQWQPILDNQIKNYFPLKITAEELDAVIPEDLISLETIMLRFRLTAQGSGSSNRFKQGMNDSGVVNTLSSPQYKYIGPYTVDINPCPPTLDLQVVPNPAPINPICNGGTNGGLTITFDRKLTTEEKMVIFIHNKIGENLYEEEPLITTPELFKNDFEEKSITFQSDELGAGTYGIKWIVGPIVEDAFSIVNSDFVDMEISEPPAVTGINPITTNVSCEGNNDGEITITPSGGIPPYTYAWTKEGDAFSLPQGSTNTHLVNLPEGNYVLVITDDNGCVSDPIEFLVETTFPSPKLDEGSTLVFQPGTEPQYLPTGSIILGNIVDGSGNYTYHWEKNGGNFQPQNPISLEGLEPATYALVIEDNDSGCLSQQHEFTINELDPLSIEISEIVEITCEGDIGILKAQGIGGTNFYTYLWSTGEQTQSINVGQGIYSVTVTDTSGDELEEQYEFNYSNPLLAVLVHKTEVICKGEATGTIELEISGGTGGPYTVDWLDAPVESSLRSNLGAREYVYYVSDGECEVTNESEPIVIGEPEEFFTVTKISQTNVTLNGESDGAFEISLDNGLPPYTFSWTKDDQPYEPTVQSTETYLMGLGKGNYQVMVTDAKGCQTTLETPIQINEPDPLAIIELKVTHVGCKGAFTGSITADVTGIAPFTYTWKKQGDISFTAPNQKTITGLSSGTYIVSVSDNSIVPAVTEVVVVTEPDKVLGAMAIPNITECFLGDEGSISINASGGVSPYAYSINGGMDFQDALEFKALNSGTYEVVVLDANQCEYRTSVVLGQPGQTNAEFAMSSQVFARESVLAIELSHPIPDRVEWVIPDEAIVLEKNPDKLEIVFHEPGEYEVGLMAYSENCLSSKTKKVVVLQGESAIKDASPESTVKKIEYFIVYPNPTNGRFNVGIGLGDTSNIKLSIFGLANNHLIRSEQAFGKKAYDIPMDLIGLPSGLYVIVLETQFGNSLQKIILH